MLKSAPVSFASGCLPQRANAVHNPTFFAPTISSSGQSPT